MKKADGIFDSRRDVLKAITGAFVSAAPSFAQSNARRRVGIVGGGMAGVSLAWLLDGQRDVVLLEARPSLGGNVQTVPIEVGGQSVAVDMGAQYFHPNLYKLYVRLLTKLGLYPPAVQESHAFPASISLYDDSEAFPRFVSPVLWDKLWPVFAPWNWEGLGAFGAGFSASKTQEDEGGDWNLTLEAWLQTLNLQRKQWEGMLLPWAASLFTGKTDHARVMSARAAMIFAATSVPASPLDTVVSYVLNRGLAEPLRRMVKQFETVEILTGAEVKQITRTPQGQFLIVCGDGRRTLVDDLVLASSGPSSLRLLEGLPDSRAQQNALGGIEFEDTRIAVHTDPIYAPKDPNHWSFLNCQIHRGYCEASMWLNKVLTTPPLQTDVKLWKSWVTHRDRQPAKVLHESTFRHMVPTVASIRAQVRLRELQGRYGVWIAGGYTFPYDCQETALVSALNIAAGLRITSPRILSLSAG
ncbi:MAG TPA: FAD-dependent oxidoreductase [Bryobacteraceae bacterium]|nr:FAD-dependent oxidoreductase [Bryobacteraceae bacterium]